MPKLFGKVLVPDAVYGELCHEAAPAVVHAWVANLPAWVEITKVAQIADASLDPLGAGERAAITLALATTADLILIDERKGTAVALSKGFEVTGTLGILRFAAKRGLIDLAEAVARLKTTNFRYRQEMLDDLLREMRRN